MDVPRRYPVFVDLAGAACLVVGGGAVAARRVAGLWRAGARVTVVAPEVTIELARRRDAGEIEVIADTFRPAHLTGSGVAWRLVVAASSDRAVNAGVVAQATSLGVWANDASDPAGGPVAVPAVADRGAVTVAVATGGVSPGAAAWLRDLLIAAVPTEVVDALDLLVEVTAELASASSTESATEPIAALGAGSEARPPAGTTARSARPDWRTLLDSGMLVDIREGRRAVAKERLKACLSSSSD